MRGAAAAVAGAFVGWVLGGWQGALVGAAAGVVGRGDPDLVAWGALALLVGAAAATVVEEPLGSGTAAVGAFPSDRETAAALGRHAGVLFVLAVVIFAVRERPRAAAEVARPLRSPVPARDAAAPVAGLLTAAAALAAQGEAVLALVPVIAAAVVIGLARRRAPG